MLVSGEIEIVATRIALNEINNNRRVINDSRGEKKCEDGKFSVVLEREIMAKRIG